MQAIRIQDRRDTRRMILMGTLAGVVLMTLVVMAATSRGFLADSAEQSAFNSCVDEQYFAARDAGLQFSWSQVHESCTKEVLSAFR